MARVLRKDRTPSTPTARAHLREAAELVEEARGRFDKACQKLSSIRGGSPLYRRVRALSEKAITLRYHIEAVERDQPELTRDDEPEAPSVRARYLASKKEKPDA